MKRNQIQYNMIEMLMKLIIFIKIVSIKFQSIHQASKNVFRENFESESIFYSTFTQIEFCQCSSIKKKTISNRTWKTLVLVLRTHCTIDLDTFQLENTRISIDNVLNDLALDHRSIYFVSVACVDPWTKPIYENDVHIHKCFL